MGESCFGSNWDRISWRLAAGLEFADNGRCGEAYGVQVYPCMSECVECI